MKKKLKIAFINLNPNKNILIDDKFDVHLYVSQNEALNELYHVKYDIIINYIENYNIDDYFFAENLKKSLNSVTSKYLVYKSFIKNKYKHAAIKHYSDLYQINNIDKLYNRIHIFQKIKSNPLNITNSYTYEYVIKPSILKRAFDIIVSFSAIILLSPVFLIVSLLIYLSDKRSILYNNKRVFSKFRIYNLYKFRTMIYNADIQLDSLEKLNEYDKVEPINIVDKSNVILYADSNLKISEQQYLNDIKNKPIFYKSKNDPRITKFGLTLRTLSIDELPQLFNILKGHMSIVGNRPLPIYEAIKLTTDEKIARFLVPAGLTGTWQIENRNKEFLSQEERIDYDNYYAKHNSFLSDFKIIFKTFKVLIHAKNI